MRLFGTVSSSAGALGIIGAYRREDRLRERLEQSRRDEFLKKFDLGQTVGEVASSLASSGIRGIDLPNEVALDLATTLREAVTESLTPIKTNTTDVNQQT